MRYTFTFLILLCLSTTKVSSQKVSKLDSLKQLVVGKNFPSFNVSLPNGERLTNADLNNKVVFVNFWFVTCPPCIAEMHGLNKLYDSLKDQKDFIFLSFTFDTEAATKAIVQKYKTPYKIIHLSKEEVVRLSITGSYPTNMILDKKGRITWAQVGGSVEEDIANAEVVWNVYPKVIEALKQ